MAKPGTGELSKLRNILSQAKNIVVLSGAGISAESGVPTFRGAGGLWRKYQSTELATPEAFKRSPSLVWEFYHYRRELVLTKQPNKAHIAIAEAERALQGLGRSLTVVTQNVDGLHQRAGSQNVIELHGSLYKTRCLQCGNIAVNTHSPIVPALADRGAPEADLAGPEIPESELPRCKVASCGGLLRPHIVWFGEHLDPQVLAETEEVLERCDACLLVGTSSLVYPAAMYAPALASKNVPVAEFNIESTPATHQFTFHLEGPCTQTLPQALSLDAIAPPSLASEVDGGSEADVGESISRQEDGTESRPGGRLSLKQKLKVAMRDYGSTVIVFHIGHSLTLLAVIYLALSSGLDLSWFLDLLGLSQSSFASGASTFVIAYAVNKVLAPLRISITLGATPFIVRYLRKIGFLKPVNK